MVPLTEGQKSRNRFRGENQEFCFKRTNFMMNFKMTFIHPSRDINKLNGCMSLSLGKGLGLKISTWELSVYGLYVY